MRKAISFVLSCGVFSAVGMLSPSELAHESAGLPIQVAAAEESADQCMGFDKQDVEKGVDYTVKNECEKKLACVVSWKLTCEDSAGSTTSVVSKNEHFKVPESNEHVVHASAESCKSSWRIDSVTWSCS